MMFVTRRSISTTLAIALTGLSIAAASGCSSDGKQAPPHAGEGGFRGAALPNGVQTPNFRLRDQRGRLISLDSLRGRVVALAFMTSDCRPCKLMAQQVRGALDELGSRVTHAQAILVSTDPGADTPAHVERFLEASSLGGRALFLSGSLQRLRSVWRAYRIPMQSPSSAEPATVIVLIDPRGDERVEFGLEQLSPEALSHDIGLLIP